MNREKKEGAKIVSPGRVIVSGPPFIKIHSGEKYQ